MNLLARKAAAKHLSENGFSQEADMVTRGEGDHFLEVRIAISVLQILEMQQIEQKPKFIRRAAGEEC